MDDFFAQLDSEQLKAVLAALSTSTDVALHTKDLAGRYTAVNGVGLKLSRREAAKFLGKLPSEVYSAGSGTDVEAHDREVLTTGRAAAYEERIKYRDGDTLCLWSCKSPLRNEQGNVIGLFGVSYDITNRKNLERRLHFLSQLAEAVPGPELGPLSRTFTNLAKAAIPAFADLCAVDLVNEEGELHRELVYHHDADFTLREKNAFMKWPPRVGDPYGATHVFGSKKPQMLAYVSDEMLRLTAQSDEHYKYLKDIGIRSLLCVPLESHGKFVGVLSLILYGDRSSYCEADLESATAMAARTTGFLDQAQLYQEAKEEIEERKEAQTELEQARDRALAATKNKSDFLARVSHEIRTPLTGLVGILELLQAEVGLSESVRERLRIVDGCAGSILAITSDIVDLASVEAGKMLVRNEPFEPRPVAHLSRSLFEAQANEKRLAILLHVERDVPRTLLGDGNRLGQILSNFVSNAVKYTPSGEVRIRMFREGDLLGVEVSDTGPGLSKKLLRTMFQPFERGEAELATPDIMGAGLGLAITRELVEAMGGTVGARNEEPRGCTFWARLPMPEAESRSHSEGADVDGGVATRGKILVVEDNAVNRKILLAQLRSLGHDAVSAEDGEQALAVLSEHLNLDLVFMDCQMPRLDGFEATRRIRDKALIAASIPIIALTASNDEANQQKCIAAGMNDFLTKPCSKTELRTVIEAWMSSGSQAAPLS